MKITSYKKVNKNHFLQKECFVIRVGSNILYRYYYVYDDGVIFTTYDYRGNYKYLKKECDMNVDIKKFHNKLYGKCLFNKLKIMLYDRIYSDKI